MPIFLPTTRVQLTVHVINQYHARINPAATEQDIRDALYRSQWIGKTGRRRVRASAEANGFDSTKLFKPDCHYSLDELTDALFVSKFDDIGKLAAVTCWKVLKIPGARLIHRAKETGPHAAAADARSMLGTFLTEMPDEDVQAVWEIARGRVLADWKRGWRRVSTPADIQPCSQCRHPLCSVCQCHYAGCRCPRPHQEDRFEYTEFAPGVFYARQKNVGQAVQQLPDVPVQRRDGSAQDGPDLPGLHGGAGLDGDAGCGREQPPLGTAGS